MITLIKWNGLKEVAMKELEKQKGKRVLESKEKFVKRMLPTWAKQRLTFQKPNGK